MSVTENTYIQQWTWFITQKQTLINITVILNIALPTGIALPMREGGATSQFDLLSLALLSVAGCGRLQLGVTHWATSVNCCQ